ncbi:Threonine tRNA ligase [Mycoplasma mycoides subsp. capri LC str. 95010]|uniref:Threonine--tRNA ligase n=1 Tax=Mycoplasma mycoides subsp. capri LC str. 95010 TaxID=862259 RepID=F4MPH2_MYCML|nr:threonine--tRNA ligase [Mycoplasma mycoides]CBW54004.1 Threonine tRNA ligase [Mycoplasma mycoides subsp. capri LC str. 95010]
MKIKLLDGSIKEYNQEISVKDISSEIGLKNVIGAKINDQLFDINYLIKDDCDLELITNKSKEYDLMLNLTAAFITSYAINNLKSINQAENFYNADEMEFSTTFNTEPRLVLDDLKNIQTNINNLLTSNLEIKSNIYDLNKALEILNNDYQKYLAKQMYEKYHYVKVYSINDFYMVVNKALILNSNFIKIIDIEQLTGSYWLNDKNNIMLQRVHGLCATSSSELKNKKVILEDRRSRDHRLINKTLNIFGFDQLVGAGLPLWLPNGFIVKNEIEKYLRQKEWEYDYIPVETPPIGTVELYKTSGHWDHYGEDMFQPFNGGKGSDEQFILRPMNCPHHIAVYKQEQRSYRDLPLRICEHAIQHRFESSGSLTGLERVRGMKLTDSHIFVRSDQIEDEFRSTYKLISEVLKTFNIQIDYLSLSLRDPNDKVKFYKDDLMWDKAESSLEKVLIDLGLKYEKRIGDAAFYGPKLDIQIKTAQNHEITVSTIQLDFLMPNKFDLTYIDKDQKLVRPIMIHRGLIGTYERFIATLLEQTKGVLPLWLAPKQVEIIPISESNLEYANLIHQKLKKEFIRSHIDLRDERLSYKIRDAQTKKVPYQLVLGNKEVENNTITYRQYGSDAQITVPIQEFIDMLKQQINDKK